MLRLRSAFSIVITIYSPTCLGQETAKGPLSLRVNYSGLHSCLDCIVLTWSLIDKSSLKIDMAIKTRLGRKITQLQISSFFFILRFIF